MTTFMICLGALLTVVTAAWVLARICNTSNTRSLTEVLLALLMVTLMGAAMWAYDPYWSPTFPLGYTH